MASCMALAALLSVLTSMGMAKTCGGDVCDMSSRGLPSRDPDGDVEDLASLLQKASASPTEQKSSVTARNIRALTRSRRAKKEDHLYRAKMAEEMERYDEMADHMEAFVIQAAKERHSLDAEQRNLFGTAFKMAVGSRRANIRFLSKIEVQNQSEEVDIAKEYLALVENEMEGICNRAVRLLDNAFIKDERTVNMAFYAKMKADYYRYIAELKTGEGKENAVTRAHQAYIDAKALADRLTPVDPVRLGLYLNFADFDFEVRNTAESACSLAKTAFDDAMERLEELSEEDYWAIMRESTSVMQLLKDHLDKWTAEDPEGARMPTWASDRGSRS